MSRVERKRLEKESRKKKLFPFSKKTNDIVLEKNKEEKASVDSNYDENIYNLEANSFKEIEEMQKKDTPKNKPEVVSNVQTLSNNEDDFGKTSSYVYSKSNEKLSSRMKTADRIISVEDEKMYLNNKKNRTEGGKDYEEDVLTVDSIFTAEDIKNGINDEEVIVQEKSGDEEIDINSIKKLDIEDAPFEDVVKVAESRLAAEFEEKKMEEEKKKKEELLKKQEEEKRIAEEKRLAEEKRKEEGLIRQQKAEQEKKKQKELLNNQDKSLDDKKEDKNNSNGSDSNNDLKEEANINKSNYSKDNNASEDKKAKKNKIEKKKVKSAPLISNINSVVDEKPKKNRTFKKVIGIIIAILLIIYIIGCVLFNGRFYPNTYVNGINVSFKTPKELDTLAKARLEGYKLTLNGRKNVKDSIKGDDIEIEYISDGSATNIKKEQGFLTWPKAFFSDSKIDGQLNIKFDESKLEKIVDDFNIFDKKNITPPVSAFPDYNIKEKKMFANKGDIGSTPVKEKVYKFVKDSIKAEAVSANYDDYVYLPQKNTYKDSRLKKAIDEIEPYTNMKIEYDFEYETFTATGQDIVKMFKVDSEKDYSVELSRDNVREFVRSLSRKYSTYGDTREIKSASTGEMLKVSGGVYGWLIDREKETDALLKLVEAKKDIVKRKPIYAQTAVSRSKNDMGNEFIEIDLGSQHMWFVRDGKAIVSTPIVSGNPNRGDATPTGIYPLNYKTRHATLRGPGYASPVSYWMPFNGDIGIHDASWQPVYGGSRYLYAGSHGCINTPYGSMAQFYSLAKEGMPVVVHY